MDIALRQAGFQAAWTGRSESLRGFENWLLCWIVLPNLGYWLLWTVGVPPRPFPVLVTGLAGLIAHRAPFFVKYALFLATMIFSALCFIAALFNLSVLSLVDSLRFAGELSPAASIEYVFVGGAVIATMAAAWWLLRRPTTLAEPRRFLLAVAVVFLAVSVDGALAASRGSYERLPDAGAPFTSATHRSGLASFATGERHVLMVMVEAMGQPVDPRVRRRLVEIWARPEVRARYEVVAGDTLFYGSTTSGEMRELCGRWGDYDEVMEGPDQACLPAMLARRGYRTEAWHSFQGSFFDRTTWYPNVGFQRTRFGPELIERGAERCPGVFPGACDRDVPGQIAAALRQAREPQFLYWLTVNSHLPVLRHRKLGTEDCRAFDAPLDSAYPMTCRLQQLFDDTARALAREISAPDFPATDILIVGDHIPPFFDSQNRSQFAPDRVPWILLRPRASAGTGERIAASR